MFIAAIVIIIIIIVFAFWAGGAVEVK